MTDFTQHELGQSYDIIREMQILWDMVGSCDYWTDKRRPIL